MKQATSNSQYPDTDSLKEFVSVQGLVELYPHLISENQLRWVLRDRQNNGLQPAVKKLGKKLMIHVPSFVAWLMKQEG